MLSASGCGGAKSDWWGIASLVKDAKQCRVLCARS